LHVEAAFGDAVIAELRKRGHQVVVEQSLGAAQAVGLAPDGGFLGSADPRGEGLADGL
jgi:gamma-glutamyltranspeptidase